MTEFKIIGTIHTPFNEDREIPYQSHESEAMGRIEVFKEYEEALIDIEGFSHIIAIYDLLHPLICQTQSDRPLGRRATG